MPSSIKKEQIIKGEIKTRKTNCIDVLTTGPLTTVDFGGYEIFSLKMNQVPRFSLLQHISYPDHNMLWTRKADESLILQHWPMAIPLS